MDVGQLQYQPASNSKSLMIDRRRVQRSAPTAQGTYLWLEDGRWIEVDVIDESTSGLGVRFAETAFEIGPAVLVKYQGEERDAVVAYLNNDADGCRLGLEWK